MANPQPIAQGGQWGDRNSQYNTWNLATRPTVTWPHRIGVVPEVATSWQQRDIDHQLAAITSGRVILSGTGGVGKTQLAVNYAEQRWAAGDLDLLLWVTATDRNSVISAYARAGADVTGFSDANPQQAAERFVNWLTTTDKRWLIVLNDLTDPADLARWWPPDTGTTVVTTRRGDTALRQRGRLIRVDPFEADEASQFLRAQLSDEDDADIAVISEDLGYLPLALAHAVAYMLDRGLTCVDYRRRYLDQRRRLEQIFPEQAPDDYHATVATTWSLSIDAADRAHPSGTARGLLESASLLDPNGIPRELFTSAAIRRSHLSELGEWDRDDITDGLHNLAKFSLIDMDDRRVRVHGLVQRAVRERLTDQKIDRMAMMVADGLMEIWLDPATDREYSQLLRANATALFIERGTLLSSNGAHSIHFRLGDSLTHSGQISAAIEYFQLLCGECDRVLGPDHVDTLLARFSLANCRGLSGDLVGAVTGLTAVLADQTRVLGPDDPATFTTRGELARCHGKSGDLVGAITALEAVLADHVRVQGPDHPETLSARGSLIHWRTRISEASDTLAQLEELLSDQLRVLGPSDMRTLSTRGHLANLKGDTGDPAAAVAELEAVLADRGEVLGPDHPHTLTTRHYLARWRGAAGDVVTALGELEALLRHRIRVLGRDHPHTLTTRHKLAEAHSDAGDAATAISELEILSVDRRRVLGPDHPGTLTTRHDLAIIRGKSGDPVTAVAELEVLLHDQVRALGADHPDVHATETVLAHWRTRIVADDVR